MLKIIQNSVFFPTTIFTSILLFLIYYIHNKMYYTRKLFLILQQKKKTYGMNFFIKLAVLYLFILKF